MAKYHLKPLPSRLIPKASFKIQKTKDGYCEACGYELTRNERFCPQCGKRIEVGIPEKKEKLIREEKPEEGIMDNECVWGFFIFLVVFTIFLAL